MDNKVVYEYMECYIDNLRDVCSFLCKTFKEQYHSFYLRDSQLNYTVNYKSLRCF